MAVCVLFRLIHWVLGSITQARSPFLAGDHKYMERNEIKMRSYSGLKMKFLLAIGLFSTSFSLALETLVDSSSMSV